VYHLPNAVDVHLFDPKRQYPQPKDMHLGRWSGIYIGALWGDWFDWELLKNLANEYPEAQFTIIGDYKGECKKPPGNLHFLGLKRQCDLPAYLANADVAIIPWKINQISQATNPLKIYEYLAMLLPVVAPNLNPLKDIPNIFLAQDQDDFIKLVGRVSKSSLDQETNANFIRQNNWGVRVNTLLQQVKDSANSQINIH
jgi:O-antigen biosynthesis protein